MEASKRSLDRLFEVLSHHRRRYILYYLENHEKQVVTLDELSDQLCAWEREWDDQTNQPEGNHRQNIRIDLHHLHLPQLADAGIVDYDARSQTVRHCLSESILDLIEEDSNECPRLETLFTKAEA